MIGAGGYTFAAWIKWYKDAREELVFELGSESDGSQDTVILDFHYANRYSVCYASTGRCSMYELDRSCTSKSSHDESCDGQFLADRWIHVALTHSSGATPTVKIYWDGVAKTCGGTCGAVSLPTLADDAKMWLGLRTVPHSGYDGPALGACCNSGRLSGQMRDVFIFDDALSASEVSALRLGTMPTSANLAVSAAVANHNVCESVGAAGASSSPPPPGNMIVIGGDGGGVDVTALLGGIVGGVVGIALIVTLIVVLACCRPCKKKPDPAAVAPDMSTGPGTAGGASMQPQQQHVPTERRSTISEVSLGNAIVPANYLPGQLLQAAVNGKVIFFQPPVGSKPGATVPIVAAQSNEARQKEAAKCKAEVESFMAILEKNEGVASAEAINHFTELIDLARYNGVEAAFVEKATKLLEAKRDDRARHMARASTVDPDEPDSNFSKEEVTFAQEGSQVPFWFVKREYVLKAQGKLPCFQELREQKAIEVDFIKREDSFELKFAKKTLVVSHRWEDPEDPDPNGEQLKVVQDALTADENLERVWYDYWSMPQDTRTQKEKAAFKAEEKGAKKDTRNKADLGDFKLMLSSVNLLYLGGTVLLIVDMSYLSRFWTQFEAWLSMQKCSAEGLRGATDVAPEEARFRIHANDKGVADLLKNLWLYGENGNGVTAEAAKERLSKSDVFVTNGSDKIQQLPKMLELDEKVKEFYTNKSLSEVGSTTPEA